MFYTYLWLREDGTPYYVGKGKVIGQYGDIRIGFRLADLTANKKGYVNLIVSKMREVDKYDNTHTVYVDEWKPTGEASTRRPEGHHTDAGW